MGTKQVDPMRKKSFDTFEHGADIGVRGWGETLEEAFQNAARAMFSIMVEGLDDNGASTMEARHGLSGPIPVKCSSVDITGLLVAWLNALLAESDIHKLVFKKFTCKIDKDQVKLTGSARGIPFPTDGEDLGIEVKGATFTMARVERDQNGRYVAQCVVDV